LSRIIASAALTRGLIFLPTSSESLLFKLAKTSVYDKELLLVFNSSNLLWALTLISAVTKNLISASGITLVPISLPSITTFLAEHICCWKIINFSRTSLILLILLTKSETLLPLIRCSTFSPFKNVSVVPSPGDNVVINGIDDVNYRLTKITAQSGSSPNFNVSIEISPLVTNQNTPEHLETLIIREKYSQVRVTGHDFLDVGTGNKPTTDYPDLYLEGYAGNSPEPFNEVTEFDGARVFYTSTDQDGNFRVGELFAVEQSTGVVSINADFFELSGLEELSLGAIQIGGSAVVIREFSKEATFVANSNNIVPTQAAIISYLESKISGGSSDALTNTLVAGQIRTTGNTISSDSGLEIIIPVDVNMTKGIDGDYLAHQFYLSNK